MRSSINLKHDSWQLGDLLLKSRMLEAAQAGLSRFPIHRTFRLASREPMDVLFDRLALESGLAAIRPDQWTLLLTGEDAFVVVDGNRKADYCSCAFSLWAASMDAAERLRGRLEDLAASLRMSEAMFSIEWHFLTGKGELQSATIEELADDQLLDAAYPELTRGVDAFIEGYLQAKDAILIIQGPPGTGKTRLIRRILARMTERKGEAARALYTGDTRAAESDEIFVKFITGWDDAFVIEDADHLLKPRADGNEHLHRFLTLADGVVRAQGRKIIFSTNLPNIRDLDDALIRPGRCYARLNCRELQLTEAAAVLDQLCDGKSTRLAAAHAALAQWTGRSISLAQVYRFAGEML